jgi:hypothetical protein
MNSTNRARLAASGAAAAAALLLFAAGSARADTGAGGGGIGNNNDIDFDASLPGGGTVLILCPGVGAGANIIGASGGYCDYGFSPGGAHIHCEWGGFNPIAGGWQCWRVWRGQPAHPRLPDPDIVPDGAPPRPDALWGPSPEDQSPHEAPQPEQAAIGGRR